MSARSKELLLKAFQIAWVMFLVLVAVIHGPMAVSQTDGTAIDARWLLSMDGKSTNSLVWNPRFRALLARETPKVRVPFWENARLEPTIIEFLSGNPRNVSVASGRYIALAAQVAKTEGNYGMLWIDAKSKPPHSIFVAVYRRQPAISDVYIYPLEKIGDLPPQFISTVRNWVSGVEIGQLETVYIANPDGSLRRVPTSTIVP